MVGVEVALKAGIVVWKLVRHFGLLVRGSLFVDGSLFLWVFPSKGWLHFASRILVLAVQEVDFVLHDLLKELLLGLVGVQAALVHHISHHIGLVLVVFDFLEDGWSLLQDLLVTFSDHHLHEVNRLCERVYELG